MLNLMLAPLIALLGGGLVFLTYRGSKKLTFILSEIIILLTAGARLYRPAPRLSCAPYRR